MDKGAIKTFAVESRRKLMEDVEYKMNLLGIAKDNNHAKSISTSEGVETFNIGGSATYSIYDEDIKKRERLIQEVNNKGFESVVEEVAYTWFNRIIAIRFMEINHYLPSKVCVLSSETPGKIEPDIIAEAFNIDLDYSDEDKKLIFKLKDENKLDGLFRFLFIKQCNKLNDILPGLFEKTEDYMELLLNISFTSEDGVVRQLIENISEEDFTNQVEIIGWLYQYYNSELKDETFANLKKRVKIGKERIPAATQLFTPDWIVKYMVENSVGRLWLESHPNEELKAKWKYYVEEAQQTPEVEAKLTEIRNNSGINSPEDITVIDPCMGSGHILVYVFDVLMQIYVSEGYTERDAAVSILENNIYGLDIDDRAYQLAYFAIMMKARQYNRKILKQNIIPLMCSIKESNSLSEVFIEELTSKYSNFDFNISNIINIFNNAKIYGSILNVDKGTFNEVSNLMIKIEQEGSNLFKFNYKNEIKLLNDMLFQSKILSKSFDAVITNPPYMGSSGMDNQLKNYLKKHYPNSKYDLFAVFIEKCQNLLSKVGFLAMITQQSFMFLSTFEKLRKDFIENYTLIDMIHLGAHAFEEIGGEVVQATSFIQRNTVFEEYISTFHRLIDFSSELGKRDEFFNKDNTYLINQNNFDKIPGSPIAYWADKHVFEAFEKGTPLFELSDIKQGLATADNNRFLRYWFEVDYHNIGFSYESCVASKNSNLKWFPCNKGGKYKKWYGNQIEVINFQNGAEELRNFKKANVSNLDFQFKQSISWSLVSSGNISFRYYPKGFVFDHASGSIFNILNKIESWEYIFAFINSTIARSFFKMISPTLNYNVGHISLIPILFNDEFNQEIKIYVHDNIQICKNDWDDYETSWDFKSHPLLRFKGASLKESFNRWTEHKLNDFNTLKSNETKLNEIFSEIYSIDINSNVEDKHVSVTKADYKNDIKSFISYAIGCMFGRYSLNEEGLQFAGGNFNINEFNRDIVDEDNIIPVLDTEYFEDDIVGKLVNFVKICFGEESLEENLDFIAGALNSKSNKSSREIIREYLLKDFFKDHSKIYNKRPIYWMFNSGKQNGFSCLVYIHRYEPNLVARVRTDYLHKTQKAIEQNIDRCNDIINSDSKNAKIIKEKNKLEKQLQETREYDEALAHIANQNIGLDLDDGVKMNYAKFQSVEVTREGQKNKTIKLLKNI
ncbi:BREX-1 system adenine-specific DNA-methyltransferase PglX [Methanobrevibacter woesei]|uniref:BREX-1 system adenine-specific DNA-methyltransferase PglX n=1 Tax=Methanobrevibacter woesei TaxID=190976 RepID=UPI0023F416DC|nr:BREX-1 system adenine-specific DNA-methyltransferase PglX [Methanobrevibacter woesei]